MRSPRFRLAALALAPLLVLSACSTDGDGTDGDSTSQTDDAATTSAAPEGDIEDLAVDTGGDNPTITWNGEDFAQGPLPFRVSSTTTTTVEEGDGEEVAAGHEVLARYMAVNGTTGEQVLSTFDADDTLTLDLSNENLFPAFLDNIPGTPAGSTLLMAIPATDAYGPNGHPQLGVGPEDTLVFYLEIESSRAALTQAEGEEVEPEEGLPEVEADGTSPATVTIPEDYEAPETTLAQVLIKGDGPEVKAGQTLKAHYTGIKLSDGEMFDNSYDRGEPSPFPIGIGRVIEGWDTGLVGQTVGSRVLLVVPAEEAYGPLPEDDGSSTAAPAHELAGETLIFIVDILGSY